MSPPADRASSSHLCPIYVGPHAGGTAITVLRQPSDNLVIEFCRSGDLIVVALCPCGPTQ